MQEKRKEVAAVTKSLQICKTYKPVWMQYVELPMSQKSAFYSGHSTELQAYSMITIMVILISMATAIYFGKWIKTTLPINLLFLLLFVQLVYVGIRWYVKGWRETRGYH